MRKLPRLLASALLLTSAVPAHDLYLLPDAFRTEPGAKLRVAVHNGDAFPESEAPPVLARLRDGQLRSRKATSQITDIRIAGKEALGMVETPGQGTLILSIHTIPNLIELPPHPFLAYLKEEGLNGVMEWRNSQGEGSKPGKERYTKFAKALVQAGNPDDFYRTPAGYIIEIIPMQNPYTLHAGAMLPVQVLFHGKPAADLQLEAAWADGARQKTVIIGRTDAEGHITVPLTNAGQWRLHSLKMERCAEPVVADWESSWASLTFEIR